MKLFKDNQGNVYAYELDGSQDHLIPSDFVALTQNELNDREEKFLKEKELAETVRQEQANIKTSALAKLSALGLTQDEVKVLIG